MNVKRSKAYAPRKMRDNNKPTQRMPPPGGVRVEVDTSHCLVLSGTTADIDTPEKRHAIAAAVTGYRGEMKS